MVAWYKMSNFILAVDHSIVIFNIQIKKKLQHSNKIIITILNNKFIKKWKQ